MTVPSDPLRDGVALADVASAVSGVAESVRFDVGDASGVAAASLFGSAGVFLHVFPDDEAVSSSLGIWLCEGDAPSGSMALSGDFGSGMGSSISALGALCGVSDLSSDGEEADVVTMLGEALSSGDVSASDVVTLGAAVTVGLVSDSSLLDVLSRGSESGVTCREYAIICGRLLRCGADAFWARSFANAVLRGDVSAALVGDFLSACEAGLLSHGMLDEYAADVEVGSVSWDNLCVVVRGRTEMCRLGR